jgi:hypothetical protein
MERCSALQTSDIVCPTRDFLILFTCLHAMSESTTNQSITFLVLNCFFICAYREYFGKELNDKIDPDVTVAWGAASVLD